MITISRLSNLCYLFLVICLLPSCSHDDKKQIDIVYLAPELREQPIHTFSLISGEGETHLLKKNNVWWIGSPVNYLAEQSTVDSILRKLIDAEIGKEVRVATADFAQLNLTSELGLTIKISYGDNKTLQLILGAIDMPNGGDTLDILGAGHSARRYVRVIGQTDKVFLTSLSYFDLSSASTFWTNYSMVRIPSFKRLIIKEADTVIATYYRTKPFGDLYLQDSNGAITKPSPGLLRCFEEFLKNGYCYEVANANLKLIPRITKGKERSIEVEGFLGVTYGFQLGRDKAPSAEEEARAALSAGMLNDGNADTRLPFLLTSMASNKQLNVFERKLLNDNLAIAERLKNRVAFIDMENAICLLEILEVEL